MRSPGQFSHALISRAKCEIATAALGNGVVPSHNVTTEIRNPGVVREDARRARQEFGFLRMWSIHPNQITPIIESMRPDFAEVSTAGALLRSRMRHGDLSSARASCMTAPRIATTGSYCSGRRPREWKFRPKLGSAFFPESFTLA